MEKMNGKLVTFTGIIVLVLLVAIFGFLFWEPKPEYIQGEAEATEVRISGKVPGRIEIFRFNEGEQVSRGDTVAILIVLRCWPNIVRPKRRRLLPRL